jgi:hypothetical protein
VEPAGSRAPRTDARANALQQVTRAAAVALTDRLLVRLPKVVAAAEPDKMLLLRFPEADAAVQGNKDN